MKILIICSGNANISGEGEIKQPFVKEQVTFLRRRNFEVDVFLVMGKGIKGYIKNLKPLKRKIKEGHYDLIHAHYGLSGMLASLQKKRPLVITFHGSDLNWKYIRSISNIAFLRASAGIFVSDRLYGRLIIKKESKRNIIPCGVDTEIFKPLDKKESRKKLGIPENQKLILFSSAFDNQVKNYPLAREAMESLQGVQLVELKNRSREEVNLLLNAVNGLLMTSHSEGSPQIVKEAIAVGCPVVSNDVGDVKFLLEGVPGCFLTTNNPIEISEKIKTVINEPQEFNGNKIIHDKVLNIESLIQKQIDLYNKLI